MLFSSKYYQLKVLSAVLLQLHQQGTLCVLLTVHKPGLSGLGYLSLLELELDLSLLLLFSLLFSFDGFLLSEFGFLFG